MNETIYPCFVSGLTYHRSNRSEIYLQLTCHPLRFCLCADSSQLICSYNYSLIHHIYTAGFTQFFDPFSSVYNEYFAPTFLNTGAVFSVIWYNLRARRLFRALKCQARAARKNKTERLHLQNSNSVIIMMKWR